LQGLALNEGAAITQSPCMSPKCTAKLTEKDFEELALPSTLQRYETNANNKINFKKFFSVPFSSPHSSTTLYSFLISKEYDRYTYFLLKEYSEKELHSVFCPNPSCGNAVVYSGAGRPTDVVECHCGTRF
jgi:hypothetical protein